MAGVCEGSNEPPGSLKANMPFVYTHQEYADIVYVYGLCDGNATAYQARFPNRRISSAQVFSRAYWQISQSCQLPSACVKKENALRQEQAQVQKMIIDIVDENPRLSTWRIAAQLDVNHMKRLMAREEDITKGRRGEERRGEEGGEERRGENVTVKRH
ncbi:hypothetical protein ANN_22255 [Periplaneta americana]|uniref:Uncharacterized protein n=1 Tax=Periplaneta americana TaxID=6978 RepID=A0ABQ8S7M9_PERAM|nr:hypothetical protein ANN_22255 [Periplaneta americana]